MHIGAVWKGVQEGFKFSEILTVELRVRFERRKLREQRASLEIIYLGCYLFHL